MDEEGYPTGEQLDQIATWPAEDFKGWMRFVSGLWMYPEWGWKERDGIYQISTAGWSGNESLISAMETNFILWSLHWYSHRRGGHYVFVSRENEPEDIPKELYKQGLLDAADMVELFDHDRKGDILYESCGDACKLLGELADKLRRKANNGK
jgi:hypothetical protein